MFIALVYMGTVPTYARECVQQLQAWSNLPIVFLTDDVTRARDILHDYLQVTVVDTSKLPPTENLRELQRQRHHFGPTQWIPGRTDLFYTSLQRFYLLEAWMRSADAKHVFHLEVDNLIYFDPAAFETQLTSKDIAVVWEGVDRVCAGVFFARDADGIAKMNKGMLDSIPKADFKSEMVLMSMYCNQHPERVLALPHYFGKDVKSHPHSKLYENQHLFGEHLFDGGSIGVWVSGIDGIHCNYTIQPKVNPWVKDIDFSTFGVNEHYDEQQRRYFTLEKDGETRRVFNLHIHNKQLRFHLSKPFVHPTNRRFIQGEWFQDQADLMIHSDPDDECVPRLKGDKRVMYLADLAKLPDGSFNNPKKVYMRGWHFDKIGVLFSKFRNPFVLIQHNADEYIHVNQGMIRYINSPMLLKYYSQSLMMHHPNAVALPIGLANGHWPHGNVDVFRKVASSGTVKKEGIYFYFSIHTARWHRERAFDVLTRKGLKWDKERPYEEYLTTLKTHKYAICPVGNGPDCHRLWECVYLNVIPIVENNPMIQHFRRWICMVIVDNFEQLDVNHLTVCIPTERERMYVEDFPITE